MKTCIIILLCCICLNVLCVHCTLHTSDGERKALLERQARRTVSRELQDVLGGADSFLKITLLWDGSLKLISEKNLEGIIDIPSCKGSQLLEIENAISKMNIVLGNDDDKPSLQCKFEVERNGSQSDSNSVQTSRDDSIDYMHDVDTMFENLDERFQKSNSDAKKDPSPRKKSMSSKEMMQNLQLTMKVWRGDPKLKSRSKRRKNTYRSNKKPENGVSVMKGDQYLSADGRRREIIDNINQNPDNGVSSMHGDETSFDEEERRAIINGINSNCGSQCIVGEDETGLGDKERRAYVAEIDYQPNGVSSMHGDEFNFEEEARGGYLTGIKNSPSNGVSSIHGDVPRRFSDSFVNDGSQLDWLKGDTISHYRKLLHRIVHRKNPKLGMGMWRGKDVHETQS